MARAHFKIGGYYLMTFVNMNPQTPNEWADYLRYVIGVNVVPADGIHKASYETWSLFQHDPVSEEQHNEWKANDEFRNGIAIIPGKVWHNPDRAHLFLFALDIDNELGIKEFLASVKAESLEQVSQKLIVEQHDGNKSRCHIYGYCSKELKKRTLKACDRDDNNIPVIEIMDSRNISVCTNSPHKDGSRYRIIGTLTQYLEPLDIIEQHIDDIYRKYDLFLGGNGGSDNNNNNARIQDLFKPDHKSYEGSRHSDLLSIINSLIARLYSTGLTEENIKDIARKWNQTQCIPPLDDREFNTIWKSAIDFQSRKQEQQQQQEATTTTNHNHYRYSELTGNKFYQTSNKPDKFIVASKQLKQLVEMVASEVKIKVDGMTVTQYQLLHTRTFLMCIPIKITRHKNPLTFLDISDKYSISFVDPAGEPCIQKHKTLSEILSNLRDLGYVMGDGAEGALSAMVQAYKESYDIVNDEELDYEGFFINKDNQIFTSKVKIKEPVVDEVKDALQFIEELKPHYEGRLDLLSTLMSWGMIAPAIFMIKKTDGYFLKWLDLFGVSYALKTTSGRIVLAFDGHHDDLKYHKKYSSMDSIPKFGNLVSKTTFPIVVDEVNLISADKYNSKDGLIDTIKLSIEGQIARSRFKSSHAPSASDIPALSPLILTSNYPPPTHDSGYMRRVISRHFPKSESYKEHDPKALQFQELLRT